LLGNISRYVVAVNIATDVGRNFKLRLSVSLSGMSRVQPGQALSSLQRLPIYAKKLVLDVDIVEDDAVDKIPELINRVDIRRLNS
jgi:hypothetical protein